jgi:electron transport complex protein RnfG
MGDFFRLTGILTLIAALAGGALSYTYSVTKPIIETNREQQKVKMLTEVLPPYDNRPERNFVTVPNQKGEPTVFYVGKKKGKLSGVAFQGTARGYAGDIAIMIGITPEGAVHGIKVLSHTETPGLGDRIARETFTRQFLHKTYGEARWEIKKRGGDFDYLTAATVSSRAVIKGIREGLSLYQLHAEEILKMSQRKR